MVHIAGNIWTNSGNGASVPIPIGVLLVLQDKY
jgi:hypothetical protein